MMRTMIMVMKRKVKAKKTRKIKTIKRRKRTREVALISASVSTCGVPLQVAAMVLIFTVQSQTWLLIWAHGSEEVVILTPVEAGLAATVQVATIPSLAVDGLDLMQASPIIQNRTILSRNLIISRVINKVRAIILLKVTIVKRSLRKKNQNMSPKRNLNMIRHLQNPRKKAKNPNLSQKRRKKNLMKVPLWSEKKMVFSR